MLDYSLDELAADLHSQNILEENLLEIVKVLPVYKKAPSYFLDGSLTLTAIDPLLCQPWCVLSTRLLTDPP